MNLCRADAAAALRLQATAQPDQFTSFITVVAGLKNLNFITLTGSQFRGPMLPEQPTPDQATICDLTSSSLTWLSLNALGGLNGSIPACLFDSSSQLRYFYIGMHSVLIRIVSSRHNEGRLSVMTVP